MEKLQKFNFWRLFSLGSLGCQRTGSTRLGSGVNLTWILRLGYEPRPNGPNNCEKPNGPAILIQDRERCTPWTKQGLPYELW